MMSASTLHVLFFPGGFVTTGEEGGREGHHHLFYIWREGDSVRSKWAALSKKALKLQPIYFLCKQYQLVVLQN